MCRMWFSLLQLIIYTQLYLHVQSDNVQIPDDNDSDWFNFKDGIGHMIRKMQSDVSFELFTRANPQQSAKTDEFSTLFDPHRQTKILIHGFQSDTLSLMVQSLKNNYLRSRDCNVIAVVWSSKSKNYVRVAGRTQYVGLATARLIDFLHDKLGSAMDLIHIIGHSLGAHAAGLAGSLTKKSVHRITGLDPALPGFSVATTSSDHRLDHTDADFVDVIHTCGGLLGIIEPVGHVDFYPNGGLPSQPGCSFINEFDSCSHSRSHEFFAESILSTVGFWGHACNSWWEFSMNLCQKPTAVMGDSTPSDARGLMFLRTNDKAPFALGFV